MKFDAQVGIIGAGTIGSMALWQLSRRGVSAMALEQFWSPNPFSSHSDESRLFRTIPWLEGHRNNERILAAAYDEWKQLEHESGRKLLAECGDLIIAKANAEGMRRAVTLVREGRAPGVEILTRSDVADRYPQHRMADDDLAVLDSRGGALRADIAVGSAVSVASRSGAHVIDECQVKSWTEHQAGVTVHSERRDYRFEKLIVASGAWASELFPMLDVHAGRRISTYFAPTDVEPFMPSRFPTFIRLDGPTFVYGAPTLDGTHVKLSIITDWGRAPSARQLDPSVSSADLAQVRELIPRYIRGLEGGFARAVFGFEGYTPDCTPYLGEIGPTGRVIACVGLCGYGFKISPVIGSILADLAITGRTSFAIDHMSPTRGLQTTGAAGTR